MKKKIVITVLILLGLLLAAGLLFMSRLDCLYGSVTIVNETPGSADIVLNDDGINAYNDGERQFEIKRYNLGDKQYYCAMTDGKTQYSTKINLKVMGTYNGVDFVEIYYYGLALENTPEKNNFLITSYVDTDGLWLEIQVTSKWRGEKAVRINKKYSLNLGTVREIKIYK